MKSINTIKETMAALNCGLTKVYRELNEGRLDGVKDGRRTFVTGASIERRIAEMKRLVTPTMLAREGAGTAEEFMPYGLMTAPELRKRAAAQREQGVKATRAASSPSRDHAAKRAASSPNANPPAAEHESPGRPRARKRAATAEPANESAG
jgi:hypothetical protein